MPIREAPICSARIGVTIFRASMELRKDRKDEAGEQYQAGRDERSVDGSERLIQRQLGEHQPSRRRNRRMGRQHASPLRVKCHAVGFGRRAALASARGLHLGKRRQIAVAQNQADVAMGNQASAFVDHVGLSGKADLNLRHDIPDQLQVHFRDGDTGVLPGAGHSQRHVRRQLAAKIDRSVMDPVRQRLGEFPIV